MAVDTTTDHLVMIHTQYRGPGCLAMAILAIIRGFDMYRALALAGNPIMTGHTPAHHNTVIHHQMFDKTQRGVACIAR